MTRSMTAFSRAEKGAATWELRSVNHRYLETSFRMPDNLRYLETGLKKAFTDKLSRGKIECSLKLNTGELETRFVINEPLVKKLAETIREVQAKTGVFDSPGYTIDLMKWPDVISKETEEAGLEEDVIAAFAEAVDQLAEMRTREGAHLAELIEQRLKDVEQTVVKAREEAPVILQHQHEKLLKRLADIDVEVDPSRIEQELVIAAQKMDVTEELDRLETHVDEVRRNLALSEPVGRRLDFLMQELNREANTLSSKAAASATTMNAVDLKVVIEQMREQIQNIE